MYLKGLQQAEKMAHTEKPLTFSISLQRVITDATNLVVETPIAHSESFSDSVE
jgi:hypothetical protein